MKQILFLAALGASFTINAQQLKLSKGQKVTITSTISQEVDMGIGQINNNSKSTSVLEVKDSDNNNYTASFKLAKLTMSMDAMGQQQSYDSEKAEDKDSEIGKSVGAKVGKEVNLLIDKTSGKANIKDAASPEKKETDEENPLEGMMQMFGAGESEAAITEAVFFIIPTGKKAGDTWSDSTTSLANMKAYHTYTLKSVNGDDATISVFTKMEGKQSMEQQGMQMDINLSAKTEGELLVNTKTSLLKKSSRVADITGNMDIMGQSMPITSKMTEVTEYN